MKTAYETYKDAIEVGNVMTKVDLLDLALDDKDVDMLDYLRLCDLAYTQWEREWAAV